jgi:hypothetical protein
MLRDLQGAMKLRLEGLAHGLNLYPIFQTSIAQARFSSTREAWD